MKKLISILLGVIWTKSIEKRSVTENGYYFYIPADRGCFDQLPYCPEMMCDHAQLRSLCLLSCGECEPTPDKNNQENLQEIVSLFQSFFSSWPGSKLMTLPLPGENSTMLAAVTAESIIEKKEDQEGRENGFIGISQPFCGNRKRLEKARKRRIVNGENTTPGILDLT